MGFPYGIGRSRVLVSLHGRERVKIKKGVPPERKVHRFPRTDDKYALFVAQLRAEYPAPEYNWKYDGGWNPADIILGTLVKAGLTKLQKFCDTHALEPSDNKRDMIKKLYLHWRASKMKSREIGVSYYGYGKGFMNTRKPDCPCGFYAIPIVRFFRRWRFPRTPQRFPR